MSRKTVMVGLCVMQVLFWLTPIFAQVPDTLGRGRMAVQQLTMGVQFSNAVTEVMLLPGGPDLLGQDVKTYIL